MQEGSLFVFFRSEWRKLLLLICMCLLYFFSYFQRIAVPGICFDELQGDFKASAAAITALGAIFLYIYGFAQFFIGVLADRYGGRRTMLAGASILAAAGIMFPLSNSLPMLYVSRAILAAGASTIFLSLVKEIDTLFNPRHFAIWLGIALFMGYSGGIFGTYPLERAISHFGWRHALLGAGLLSLAALVLAFIVFRLFREDRAAVANRNNRLYIGTVLKNKLSYPPMIASMVIFAIYFLFQASIGKKMLTDCCGITSARAAGVTFVMMIVCAVASSLSGFISRLIGNRRKPIIIACSFLNLATNVCLALHLGGTPDHRLIAAGFIILALAASPAPITLSSAKEVNSRKAAATSVGIANCTAYVLVAVVSNLAGIIMDSFAAEAFETVQGIVYPTSAYRLIILFCAGLAAIGFTASLFVRETRGNYLTSH